jgi:hypothetical protein
MAKTTRNNGKKETCSKTSVAAFKAHHTRLAMALEGEKDRAARRDIKAKMQAIAAKIAA